MESVPEDFSRFAALAADLQRFGVTNAELHHDHRSPLNGASICTLQLSDASSVALAFGMARATQTSWAAMPISARAKVLLRFHDLLLERTDEILDLVQLENGKARGNAADEVAHVLLTARYYALNAEKILRRRRRRGALPVVTKALEVRHARGVVGFISPWNYPLTLAVSDMLPALMAGNAAVLLPDLQTSLTALWVARLLHEAGIPLGLVNVVVGRGAELGSHVINGADFVMFTGSTATGRIVAEQAGRRLIASTMELGGKNSMIIGLQGDVKRAARHAVRGAFANSGQLCIGTERIFVHSTIYREFEAEFVKQVSELKVGNTIGWGSDMGVLTTKAQLDVTQRHIADAVAAGARVLCGGNVIEGAGPLAFAPTVLADVPLSAEVCRSETFGPVAALYSFTSDDEVVARVNDTDSGLSASIISPDIAWARRLAPRLHVGAVNINEAFASAFASIDAPMGGWKSSGVGRRQGAEGLLQYTEPQVIARQRFIRLQPQWGMSDEAWARFMLRSIAILKALRFK